MENDAEQSSARRVKTVGVVGHVRRRQARASLHSLQSQSDVERLLRKNKFRTGGLTVIPARMDREGLEG